MESTFLVRHVLPRGMILNYNGKNKNYTVSQKVPTFKLSVTLSNLNRFLQFFTNGKRKKFATKPIKNSSFLQIWKKTQIAF